MALLTNCLAETALDAAFFLADKSSQVFLTLATRVIKDETILHHLSQKVHLFEDYIHSLDVYRSLSHKAPAPHIEYCDCNQHFNIVQHILHGKCGKVILMIDIHVLDLNRFFYAGYVCSLPRKEKVARGEEMQQTLKSSTSSGALTLSEVQVHEVSMSGCLDGTPLTRDGNLNPPRCNENDKYGRTEDEVLLELSESDEEGFTVLHVVRY